MGLQLKKVGNDIGNVLGGREIHPINVRVGGFYRVPTKTEFEASGRKPEVGRGRGGRHRPVGRGTALPGFRTGLRVRQPAPSGRVSDERGTARLQPRARYRDR